MARANAATPEVSDVPASSSNGKPDDPNRFGEEAKELAQADEEDDPDDGKPEGSEMGEHSRENDAKQGPGRLGIGNLPGHPSESISGLCDNDEGDQCPGAIAD
ncbi:MAG: hypothetical protein WAM27_06015 [Nitrososphaeraceae archaeon]